MTQMTGNPMMNWLAQAGIMNRQPNQQLGPAASDMWRRQAAMMQMGGPMAVMGRQQNPNFYTPDWNAIFGPSLDRYQQQADQTQQNQQNSIGGMNGPIRRGLGNLLSGLGGGNFMDNWRRGYMARRGIGMGGMVPGI